MHTDKKHYKKSLPKGKLLSKGRCRYHHSDHWANNLLFWIGVVLNVLGIGFSVLWWSYFGGAMFLTVISIIILGCLFWFNHPYLYWMYWVGGVVAILNVLLFILLLKDLWIAMLLSLFQ